MNHEDLKSTTQSASGPGGPFLALPYLVFLHRQVVLPERIRQRVWADCRRQCQEAERQMNALELRLGKSLSSRRLQTLKDLNRQELAKLTCEAEAKARRELASHLREAEALVRNLHSQAFRAPQPLLEALFAASNDLARTRAIQALANHILLFLRTPLNPVEVSVATAPSPVGRYAAGSYVPPGLIRIRRRTSDSPSRLLAILAHEMCHHVQHAFRIEPAPGLDGERLTDAAAIYFNFTQWILPEYDPVFSVIGDTLVESRLGYLKPRELERAHHYARLIQDEERPISTMIEPGGLRIRKDALGNRVALPFDSPFHGVVMGHAEARLQFYVCNLLRPDSPNSCPSQFTFITNKISALCSHQQPVARKATSRKRSPRARSYGRHASVLERTIGSGESIEPL